MPPRDPADVARDPHQPELPGPAHRAQWLGMFLAPAAFLAHLQIDYLLVLYVCGSTRGNLVIYAAAVLAILVALAGCGAAAHAWSRSRGAEPDDATGTVPRTRMLGMVGLGMSAILTLLLIAQLVAAIVAPTCE